MPYGLIALPQPAWALASSRDAGGLIHVLLLLVLFLMVVNLFSGRRI